MAENTSQQGRPYTVKLRIEISDGVLSPKKLTRTIDITPGTMQEVRQQLDDSCSSLDRDLKLLLRRGYRDFSYLTTTGWANLLATGND